MESLDRIERTDSRKCLKRNKFVLFDAVHDILFGRSRINTLIRGIIRVCRSSKPNPRIRRIEHRVKALALGEKKKRTSQSFQQRSHIISGRGVQDSQKGKTHDELEWERIPIRADDEVYPILLASDLCVECAGPNLGVCVEGVRLAGDDKVEWLECRISKVDY